MSKSIFLQNISKSIRSIGSNRHISIWHNKYSCHRIDKHKSYISGISPFQRSTCYRSKLNNPEFKINHNSICISAFRSSSLIDSLTEEKEERLTQIITSNDSDENSKKIKTSTRKKFKLQAILKEIQYLEEREFPLPAELKDEHWHDLLNFDHRSTRIYYLDAVVSGKLNEEAKVQFYKDDQVLSGPIVIPESIENEVLTEGDTKKIQRLDEIKYTYESLLQNGHDVYPFINETDLQGLLELDNRGSIVKTIKYINERQIEVLKQFIEKRVRQFKGAARKQARLDRIQNSNHIVYGLGHNTIFFRVYPRDIEKIEKNKVLREFNEWGQPLVIDLSFLKNMSMQQVKSLWYREMNFALKFNAESREPFVIYLTNYDPKCPKCTIFKKASLSSDDDDYPVVISEKSYLELFPQENLLYLTPDSRNNLNHYDANDVYIIGGIVDNAASGASMNRQSVPYTLSAAKKQGIRHARLPMKKTLGLTNELNVDHVVAIMADFKYSKDWFYSLRWLPARHYKNRLKSASGFTPRMEAVYLAHKELSPMVHNNHKREAKPGKSEEYNNEPLMSDYKLLRMHANEYRQRYKEIVEETIKNAETDARGMVLPYDKYMWKQKDARTKDLCNMMFDS